MNIGALGDGSTGAVNPATTAEDETMTILN
jgi:hypothetical protein